MSEPTDKRDHGHCPYEHEHPQPFMQDDKEYCGACWFKDKRLIEMVPCDIDNCE